MAVNLISRMLVTDPKKRASLAEIKQHVWVREGFQTPIDNYVPERPATITAPNADSLMELVSYGFKEQEVLRVLKNEMNLHPVVSLYHLIDEARRRIHEDSRKNSLATIGSAQDSNSSASIQSKKPGNKYFGLGKTNRRTAPDETGEDKQEVNAMANNFLAKNNSRPKRRSSNPTYTSNGNELLDFSIASNGFTNNDNPVSAVTNVVATPERSTAYQGKVQNVVTTRNELKDIFAEIERVMSLQRVSFAKTNSMSYTCDDNGCRFMIDVVSVEVHQQPRSVAHEIRFKKINAFWSWNHKSVIARIIKDLKLE